jgi:hypothetical protein
LTAYFESGRSFRQRGGIYFPPIRHRVIIASPIKANMLDDRTFHAEPPVALSLGASDVYELNSNPFVEKFFFRHSKDMCVNIDSLELLWPSRTKDALLSDLCGIAEKECARYLRDYKCGVLDEASGLIDRGYQEQVSM